MTIDRGSIKIGPYKNGAIYKAALADPKVNAARELLLHAISQGHQRVRH
jgi:hypothetical protein